MWELNDASVFRERGPPARPAAELYNGYGLSKGRVRAPGRGGGSNLVRVLELPGEALGVIDRGELPEGGPRRRC